jgi:hypothetical protein
MLMKICTYVGNTCHLNGYSKFARRKTTHCLCHVLMYKYGVQIRTYAGLLDGIFAYQKSLALVFKLLVHFYFYLCPVVYVFNSHLVHFEIV